MVSDPQACFLSASLHWLYSWFKGLCQSDPPVYFRCHIQWTGRWINFCQNPHTDTWTVCFLLSTVCDVLPLIINNHDVRLPANLLYKYLNKAAEFYINYVTRSTQVENQHQGKWEHPHLLRPDLLKSFRSPLLHLLSLWVCASLIVFPKDASRKRRKKKYVIKRWDFSEINSTPWLK